MSLEAKIGELTAAVKALTLAMPPPVVMREVMNSPLDEIKRGEIKPMAESPNEPPKSTSPTSEGSLNELGEKTALTYNDVKAATLKLSQKKGREAAVDLLSRYGVKGAQGLSEDQWADFVAQADEAING